ncbi:AraC family transcriptional regulator [Flammeovirga pectinis]|uniref:AraC family transcriptional regulator n=1 Tax=Flammeovirga pectinis TaxID=2494373 RepID=A0A3S9P6B0_9BACT|nr:helix-turn-helix transcriptional regulator [Flammeovirga pectinis]AZQ63759.1 AraC family transcriptional regulator [Flammeovirga pectinis]
MEKIPNISFKTDKFEKGFEIIPFSVLFDRLKNTTGHNPKKLHRIQFFILFVITEGYGTHQVDLTEYKLKKGSVLKVAKGQIHAFTEELHYEGYCIVFTEDFLLKYFSSSSIYAISHFYNYHLSFPVVKDVSFNDFFIRQIKKEIEEENAYLKLDLLAKILEIYLLRLERDVHSTNLIGENKKYYLLFSDFRELVNNEYSKTRNVKDYAQMLSISSKHLNYIVKNYTSTTAKSFIDEYVLLEVKRTLLTSNFPLKEVAYMMGFDEVTNFTKFFKKHTGITPKEYR